MPNRTQSDPYQHDHPVHRAEDVRTLLDSLHQHLQVVATTTPEELDSTPTALLARTKGNVERILYLLEEAAEERSISCAPLTEIEHRWELLWRKYPDPKEAIKHFRDFFPLPRLNYLLQQTTARLNVLTRIELKRGPTPARAELHLLAQVIRSIPQDTELPRYAWRGMAGSSARGAAVRDAFSSPAHASLRQHLQFSKLQAPDPESLIEALVQWLKDNGYLPDTMPSSDDPHWFEQVADAVKKLADELPIGEAGDGLAAAVDKWSPPEGYVFAGAIRASDGKVVPRQTVQGWAEKDKPKRARDPKTGAIYYEGSWVKGRLEKYRPRRR